MAPIVALAVTALVPVLAGLVRQRAAAASLLLGAGLVASPVRTLLTAPPPFFRDDVRPIMTYLKSNAREGEPLYVYWGAWHAWQVYGRLSPSMELIMGGCPRDYPRGHLHELDSMRGSPRAWILFTRVYDLPTQHLMLSYLDAIGVRQDSLSQTPPDGDRSSAVTLFSYDLSDTTRLSAASAASFPVPNADRRENCFGPDVIWRRADGSRAVTLF
jgi:hypothetical protein